MIRNIAGELCLWCILLCYDEFVQSISKDTDFSVKMIQFKKDTEHKNEHTLIQTRTRNT